jgi:hypothetical protein
MLAELTHYRVLYQKSFINGMLYAFTFGESTPRKIAKKHKDDSDGDNMLRDWENVGEYINQACKKFKEENEQ